MANRQDMDFTYTFLDRVFRFSLGEHGDFSGALYDGDFSLSLEEAQRRKHDFVASQLHIGPGTRVLDMGCGWGPFLVYANGLGARTVGVTLSRGQAAACRRHGLDVHLVDCREIGPETFGPFDAVVSLGAFEHFCTLQDYRAGRQEEIYRRFFGTVADLLPERGRFYLQTMVFGRNMISADDIDANAPVDSDPWVVAQLARQFPGSWLPYGFEQIVRCAEPRFGLVSRSSGRLDYIETIRQWGLRYRRFSWKKYAYYASLLPRYGLDAPFREHVQVLLSGSNRKCFEREILDHFRLVFEKT
jgi:cyclopropane-fatty-acyl-phospholipid synthase